MADFTGTTGDDAQAGTSGDESFDFSQGGHDDLSGGAGADTFEMGAQYDALDEIDGGDGLDTVVFNGSYASAISLGANVVGVEQITLAAGNSYELNVTSAFGMATDGLKVDAGALAATHALTLTVDASITGTLNIIGGAGNDVITSSLNALTSSIATGLGNDTVTVTGGTIDADSLSGGDGTDTLVLDGVVVVAANFDAASTGFEKLDAAMFSGDDTANTMDLASFTDADSDGNYEVRAEGGDDTINGLLDSSGRLHGNEGADQLTGGNNRDRLRGNAGDDGITGGAGDDQLKGGEGTDIITGGAGVDTIFYSQVAQSTGSGFDLVRGFNAQEDKFSLNLNPTAIDAAITVGTLSFHDFDDELAAAVDAAHLAAGHAVLFTPDDGRFAGETFLVIDVNGTAGYQAAADLVIGLEGVVNLGDFDITDFA